MTDCMMLLPEILIAIMAMVLLLIGAFRGDGAAQRIADAGVVALLAALVLVVACDRSGVAFYGMIAVDDFRRFAKVLVLIAGAACLALAGGDKTERAVPEYPVLILLATLGMMLMVSANDWIALYVGLELQNLALYVLVALRREEKRSSEAGLKYFMLSAFASAILLFGLSLLYGFAGGTGFAAMKVALAGGAAVPMGALAAIALVVAGFAFKLAAVPFHMWAPDVYEGAGASVTAFLAAAPKVAGVALLSIVLAVPLAGGAALWQPFVIVLAVASMVFGALGGLMQGNIKRLMAYSGIANIGAILVGLVCLERGVMSVDGLSGVLIYLAVYVAGVVGIFAALLMLRKDGTQVEAIADMAGLSKAHPALAAALAAALFSVAGIPPLAGFFGKYFVFLAAVQTGLWPLALIGVLSSVVVAGYTLRIVKKMYFDDLERFSYEIVSDKRRAAALALAALFVSLFVLAPAPLLEAAGRAAESLLVP